MDHSCIVLAALVDPVILYSCTWSQARPASYATRTYEALPRPILASLQQLSAPRISTSSHGSWRAKLVQVRSPIHAWALVKASLNLKHSSLERGCMHKASIEPDAFGVHTLLLGTCMHAESKFGTGCSWCACMGLTPGRIGLTPGRSAERTDENLAAARRCWSEAR